jgi:hypothetical protein
MRKRIAIALLAVLPGVVFLISPGIGAADPKPPVGAHLHLIVLQSGERVHVGPDICPADNPTPTDGQKQAFYNFHWNVHRGADGLDNDLGAEIISAGCPTA